MNFLFVEFFLIVSSILFSTLPKSKSEDRTVRSYWCIRNGTLYLVFVFVFLGLLVTMRSANVGNDTETYIDLFDKIAYSSDISDFLLRYEIGYIYLNKLISYFSRHSQSVIIVVGIITTLGFYYFINKYSKMRYLSVFMFVLLRYLDQSMNTLRQSIALVIILYAYKYIESKNFFLFFLFVLLAYTFHNTAIIFLLSWFIVKLLFTKRNVVFLLGTLLFLYIGFDFLFTWLVSVFPVYSYYIDGKYFGEARIASILNAIVIACFIILILCIRKNVGIQLYRKLGYEKMLMLVFVGLLVTIVSFKFNLFDRISVYYNAFLIILVPNTISLVKNVRGRLFNQLLIILFLSIYYFSIIVYRPEWNRIYPYTFF